MDKKAVVDKKIIDVFRCKKKEGAYIYVAKGKNLDELPEALRKQTGALEHSMTLVLTPDRKLAQADAQKVLNAIEEQGFYLQMPPRAEAYMQNIPNDKLTQKPIDSAG